MEVKMTISIDCELQYTQATIDEIKQMNKVKNVELVAIMSGDDECKK